MTLVYLPQALLEFLTPGQTLMDVLKDTATAKGRITEHPKNFKTKKQFKNTEN